MMQLICMTFKPGEENLSFQSRDFFFVLSREEIDDEDDWSLIGERGRKDRNKNRTKLKQE